MNDTDQKRGITLPGTRLARPAFQMTLVLEKFVRSMNPEDSLSTEAIAEAVGRRLNLPASMFDRHSFRRRVYQRLFRWSTEGRFVTTSKSRSGSRIWTGKPTI